jgi:hypothetical protein
LFRGVYWLVSYGWVRGIALSATIIPIYFARYRSMLTGWQRLIAAAVEREHNAIWQFSCYASAMPAQLANVMRLQNFTPISDCRYFELAIPDCGASEAQP